MSNIRRRVMGGQKEPDIEPVNGFDYVDLGLPSGVLWATGNLTKDASGNYYIAAPTEYGAYFSWGDIEGHNVDGQSEGYSFSSSNYSSGASGSGHSYNSGSISGDATYDAARAKLGGTWRIPEYAEFNELINNCTWNLKSSGNSDYNGVAGFEVVGPNGKKVFLPAAGYYSNTTFKNTISGGVYAGHYWTSGFENSSKAYLLYLNNSKSLLYNDRRLGYSIRPVTSTPPTKVIFKVTTTDGSSVEGVELTISNGSEEYTVTTDATGRVALAGLYGTYTISSETHNLNISSFTANGNMTVNISATLKAIQYTQVIIDQTKSDPAKMITLQTIDGQADAEAGINAIRANSHRYVGTFASNVMSIKQLDDNDSTLYADGTSAATDIATIGKDVWMRLPKFWWKCETVATDKFRVTVAYGRKPSGSEWKEWSDQQLVAVFRSYVSSNKLYSSSAKTATDKVGKANSVAYAGARGAGFHLVTWEWHCIMALLYYVKYRNTYCAEQLGSGAQNVYATGVTNQLGMADGVSTDSSGNKYINFWGLECWWHGAYEFLHNVTVSSSKVCTLTDISGNTVRTIGTYTEGYSTKMLFDTYFDCLSQTGGGTLDTGYCCRMLAQSAAGMMMRSGNGGGQFNVATLAHRSDNTSTAHRLSRLAFTGKVVVE